MTQAYVAAIVRSRSRVEGLGFLPADAGSRLAADSALAALQLPELADLDQEPRRKIRHRVTDRMADIKGAQVRGWWFSAHQGFQGLGLLGLQGFRVQG